VFALEPYEVPFDVPQYTESFAMTFDILTRSIDEFPSEGIKFNLFHFFIDLKYSNGEVKNLYFAEVKLILKEVIADDTIHPDRTVFKGKIQFEIVYKYAVGFVAPFYSQIFEIVLDKTAQPNEIINSSKQIFKTLKNDEMEFVNLLSPQILSFEVFYLI
jgi:hypothetical protein